MTKTNLRDYQIECLKYFESNERFTVFCLPTGTGKTVTMVELVVRNIEKYPRVLIVAPTIFIKDQIKETFEKLGHGHLLTGTVLVRVFKTASMRKYSADLVIFDECHRIACATNQAICELAKRVIGFTATPVRLDGLPLLPLNDIFEPHPIGWYMDRGYLCGNIKEITAPYPNIQDITDFDEQWTHYNNRKHFADILESYQKYASPKARSIVFGTTLEHCERLKDAYLSLGLKAETISFKDSDKDKTSKMSAFKKGSIDMLINVFLVSEGADIPDCDLVIFCAFTKSINAYYQRVGRVLRPKKEATIIDHSGMIAYHLSVKTNPGWTSYFYEALEDHEKSQQRQQHVILCPECLQSIPSLLIPKCPHCGFEITPETVSTHRLDLIPSFVKKDLVIYERNAFDELIIRLKRAKTVKTKLDILARQYPKIKHLYGTVYDETLFDFMLSYASPQKLKSIIK